MPVGTLTVYNPGEPVFDPSTGEPYIDEYGALVEVQPGLKVDTADGRVLDGDDVANAAWYRANKFLGETIRDRTIGVPYLQQALGGSDAGLAATSVVGEVSTRTPGVAGVVGVRIVGLDTATRVLQFLATLLRKDGRDQDVAVQSGG